MDNLGYTPRSKPKFSINGEEVAQEQWMETAIVNVAIRHFGDVSKNKTKACQLIAEATGRSLNTVRQWQSGANRLTDEQVPQIVRLLK